MAMQVGERDVPKNLGGRGHVVSPIDLVRLLETQCVPERVVELLLGNRTAWPFFSGLSAAKVDLMVDHGRSRTPLTVADAMPTPAAP
jgi:hypothetical protein